MNALLSRHALFILLLQLFLILSVARLLGRLADRLGSVPVVGELLTGVVLGPSLFGWLAPSLQRTVFPSGVETLLLQTVTWLGLVLLLTLTGLEVDRGRLRRHASVSTVIAAGSIFVPFVTGFAFGWVLPASLLPPSVDRLAVSLFVATALSISAIPVVARVLLDLGILGDEVGQVTLVAAMINDTIGWLLLSLVAGVARVGRLDVTTAATSLVALVGFLLVSFTVGQWLVDAVFRAVGGDEVASLSALVVLALGASATTQALGLEAVLGAFVVGVLVGETPAFDASARRSFAVVTLAVFAPLFFGSAGLRVDLTALAPPLVAVVALAALGIAIVGKFLGTLVGARVVGYGTWDALGLGAGLNARGAMEIVVATVGLGLGVLTTELYTIIVLIAIVTSVMAAPVASLAFRRAAATRNETSLWRRSSDPDPGTTEERR